LPAYGHSLELLPLPRGLARWRLGVGLAHVGLVVLQRRLFPGWQLSLLRQRVGRLAFDFDDAVFLRDSYHRQGSESATLRRRFRSMMGSVDAVIAGNNWLAHRATESGARFVRVIPTCVDPNKYVPQRSTNTGSGLTLVWVGSASTVRGLARARPLLEHLGQQVPGLTLRLVCDAFVEFKHLRVERVLWTAAGESDALATADVGLSLLPDDDWSRGKCGLKILQYFAAGLPVLGNAVGVTAEMLGPNATTGREAGLLPESPGDWLAAFDRLRDPVYRIALGEEGRRRCVEQYSIANGVARWARLLDELALPARQAV
jgi:glycosyltransferase involved in cell wall biosynthesis